MGRADQAVARTDSVRIKLAPAMVERLERLALDFGMPVSTMGAFAIGAWINQQEQTRLNSVKILEGIAAMVGEQISKADLAEVATATQAAVVKVQNRDLLDHDAAPARKAGAS